MRASVIGLLFGLFGGLAVAFGDFGDFLIVEVIGALGLLVGRAVDGDLDVSRFLTGRRSR